MNIVIEHHKDSHQFIYMEGGRTARLDYIVLPDGKTLDYHSTYVPPELRGQQIGQTLVKYALDYAKENHYKIIPSCSFVDAYIKRHPEYNKVLVE